MGGGFLGLLITVIALGPLIAAGEQVPIGSFVVAIMLMAALAFIGHAVVRWRWRVVRSRYEDY